MMSDEPMPNAQGPMPSDHNPWPHIISEAIGALVFVVMVAIVMLAYLGAALFFTGSK